MFFIIWWKKSQNSDTQRYRGFPIINIQNLLLWKSISNSMVWSTYEWKTIPYIFILYFFCPFRAIFSFDLIRSALHHAIALRAFSLFLKVSHTHLSHYKYSKPYAEKALAIAWREVHMNEKRFFISLPSISFALSERFNSWFNS